MHVYGSKLLLNFLALDCTGQAVKDVCILLEYECASTTIILRIVVVSLFLCVCVSLLLEMQNNFSKNSTRCQNHLLNLPCIRWPFLLFFCRIMFVFHVQHSRISTGIYTHIFAIDSNQVEAYVRTLSTICQPTNQPTAKKVQIFQNEKKNDKNTHTHRAQNTRTDFKSYDRFDIFYWAPITIRYMECS